MTVEGFVVGANESKGSKGSDRGSRSRALDTSRTFAFRLRHAFVTY